MSHHIYHTRALILGSIPVGESNKFYKIFTEELGLLWASAQAVRTEKSKLRYALQHFSWITIDLVKGREVWRITNAREEVVHLALRTDIERLRIFLRVCALISRMMHGEGQERELFEDLFRLANFLNVEKIPEALVPILETLASARVLARLGYFDDTFRAQYATRKGWSLALLEDMKKDLEIMNMKINDALASSHL